MIVSVRSVSSLVGYCKNVFWSLDAQNQMIDVYAYFCILQYRPLISISLYWLSAGRTGFGSLLSLGHSSGKTDRIYMKGPGGRGEVEVAVSGVLDQSKTSSGPNSPTKGSKKIGFGTLVRTAAFVASTAAKQAYAAASSHLHPEDEMLPLKCCLMSISLPWETIANDLLFKVTTFFYLPIFQSDRPLLPFIYCNTRWIAGDSSGEPVAKLKWSQHFFSQKGVCTK